MADLHVNYKRSPFLDTGVQPWIPDPDFEAWRTKVEVTLAWLTKQGGEQAEQIADLHRLLGESLDRHDGYEYDETAPRILA